MLDKLKFSINHIFYWNNTKIEFLKFCLVGASALIIESVIIYLLFQINIPFKYSRLISLPLAILFTWYFNRIFTFRSQNQNKIIQFSRYFLLILFGIMINFSVYIFIINLLESWKYSFILAIIFGSGSSALFNFTISKFKIFKI